MRYLIRRLGLYVVAGWAAITINFIIPRLMPGNPAEALLTRFHGQLSPTALHSLDALFGTGHQGIVAQYGTYLKDLATGNLGVSYTYFPTSVASVISGSLPWTIVLIGASTVISFVLGTLIGVIVAWKRGSWRDVVLPVSTFLSSIPYFWFGLIVLLLLSEHAHVFPASGGYSSNTTIGLSGSFLSSAAYHAVLPALTIVVASIGGWILGMRNMVLTTMSEDYVLLAQAKGLTPRRVMYMYAARNAILPSVANFAMSLGFVVSGAILTEVVFSYPGIGYVLFQAVSNEDYPLMQGIFLVITFAVLVANLLADIVYVLLDPRTRQEGERHMSTGQVTVPASAVQAPQGRRWRSVLRSKKTTSGLIIIGFFIVIAIIGPWIAPDNPSTTGAAPLAAPSAAHLLGTTQTGQDVLSQLIVGTRISMLVGFVAAAIASLLSMVVGLAGGYFGGVIDEVLDVVSNVFLVIPSLPLVIVLAGYLPSRGSLSVAVVISVTGWAWGARVMRAQTLSIRRRDYVEAARATGESTVRILFVEILPNELAIVAANFLGTVTFAILTQAGLAFLGLSDVSTWSWGTMLYWAQSAQALELGAWWWFIPPGLCIALVGTGLVLVNFGIDEFIDPRLRGATGRGRRGRRFGLRARRRRPPRALTPVDPASVRNEDRHSER